MTRDRAVLDTNVFVAAGFNPRSSSAALVERARRGTLVLVWNEATRRETRGVLRRIPRLEWSDVEPLFAGAGEWRGELSTEPFRDISDPDDRKFAALAAATGAVLVTNDAHLLDHRERTDLTIETPSDHLRRLRAGEAGPT